jgi:peptide/nickel transport system substrate-binding protein
VGVNRPQAIPIHRTRRASLRVVLPYAVAIVALLGLAIWIASRLPDTLSADVPSTGGIYREAVVGEIMPLDPLPDEREPRDPDLSTLLFRGLVEVDEHGEIYPDLAERWALSGEGRVYTFFLRRGLRWADGEPLTSADVVFTVQRAALATTPGGQPSFWAAVQVRALGPEVVEFVLREPLGAFLERAALPLVAAHGGRDSLPTPGSAAASPPSSGPYRLASRQPELTVLERNANYHGPTARLDRVEFHSLPTREAAVQALRSGQVDGLGGLSPAERTSLSGSERVDVHAVPEFNKYGLLVLNTQGGIFRERSVRQAVARAIDREALIRVALEGAGEAAIGPLSPLSWAFDLGLQYQPYDPASAQELLNSAGWLVYEPDGRRSRGAEPLKISLLTSDAPARLIEASEVARQLRLVGFEVDVRPVRLEELLRDFLQTGEFQVALVGRWLAQTDPDQFALWHSTQARGFGSNYAGISVPELDRWLEIGRRQVGPNERGEAYRRFQAVWAEEQPSVLLYYPHTVYALSRDVLGVRGGALPDASWRLRRLPEWHRQTTRELTSWTRFLSR